jgi:hypothetical protein
VRFSRPRSAPYQLLDEAGAETWHRILNAIERLQAKAPAECIDVDGAELSPAPEVPVMITEADIRRAR